MTEETWNEMSTAMVESSTAIATGAVRFPAERVRKRQMSSRLLLTSVKRSSASARDSLYELAAKGDVRELARRLEKSTNADVNATDEDGRTMLHHAVENEREAVVRLLMELPSQDLRKYPRRHMCASRVKIDASIQDNHKRNALFLSVATGNQILVELVVNMTRNVDAPGPNGRTPLHVAVFKSMPEITQLLIRHGASPLSRDEEETTPVGLAARIGSLIVLDILITNRPSAELIASTSGSNNSSLLHLAVESGVPNAVVYLLSRSVNKQSKDSNGFTAVHVASRLGNVAMLRQLLVEDQWLCDVASHEGLTPVHEAAKYDQVAALRFLLSKGANSSAKTPAGATPLLIAASFGASKTVSELLSLGINFTAVDGEGVNVLQHAVGHRKTLRVLVENLKDKSGFEELVSSGDSRGATALHYAASYGNLSDVAVLVQHEANLAAGDQNGATALHLACGRGDRPIVDLLSSYAPRLLSTVDGYGRTPLYIASLYGHTKLVANLIENGAALLPDLNGRTVFHCSAWQGSIECMKVLLSSFPARLNNVDEEKVTALHLAVMSNHPDMVVLLLDSGASIIVNEIGQNCLDVAINRGLHNCAYAIANHERWKEAMMPLNTNIRQSKQSTQLQLLVEKMPEVALVIMDKCVKMSANNSEREFDFSYILGVTDKLTQVPAMASVRLLESMIRLKRTRCLSHPLCVEYLNSKWRKFGAFILIANAVTYSLFLLLLMAMVIVFPAYSPRPLEHREYLERLLDAVETAQKDNRSSLNYQEKITFCYGHSELRLTLLIATVFCLVKEMFPLWYKGLRYFRQLSNDCELAVYALTLVFLDPFGLLFAPLDIPIHACPTVAWEIAAMATFLGWIVLLLNLQRLPHVGIYIVMVMSMVTTTLRFVVVASLLVTGFGLAFYMLMNNEDMFTSGGLSLMRVVLMAVGDLAYNDILPIAYSNCTEGNLSAYYALLRSHYREFSVTRYLAHINTINVSAGLTCNAEEEGINGDHLLFHFLPYVVFIFFSLLMPVVVLNTLIGLAVGDIAAVQADAALRQIRMQVKLLVELESALPSWFLNRVQVRYSRVPSENKRTLSDWVRHVVKAADEPPSDVKTPAAIQLAEIKSNLHMLNGWLSCIEESMQQHRCLLNSLAAAVKRQKILDASPGDIDDQWRQPDAGVFSRTDLRQEVILEMPLSFTEDDDTV